MEEFKEISLPVSAKTNKKVDKNNMSLELDPWSNKPQELPTLVKRDVDIKLIKDNGLGKSIYSVLFIHMYINFEFLFKLIQN